MIAANFVIFTILALITVVFYEDFLASLDITGNSDIDCGTGYGLAFVIWASISTAIDTGIAGIMIWSVREI